MLLNLIANRKMFEVFNYTHLIVFTCFEIKFKDIKKLPNY